MAYNKSDRDGARRRPMRRRKKVCAFCADKEHDVIDYKDVNKLRHEIAVDENVPPYMVFGDSTLKELSSRMPVNKEQMLEVSGVGERKFDKYGDRFIEKIISYINCNNINHTWISKVKGDISIEKNNIDGTKSIKEKSYINTVDILRTAVIRNSVYE